MRAAVDLKPKPIEEIQNPIEEILCKMSVGPRLAVPGVQCPDPPPHRQITQPGLPKAAVVDGFPLEGFVYPLFYGAPQKS
jgi:hypothetical protein